MKVRITAALLTLLAVFGLAGCSPQAGAAAFVGSHRISEKTVDSYLTPRASASPVANQDGSTGVDVPRRDVLQYLILDQLFTASFPANGLKLTDADLDGVKSVVLQSLQASGISARSEDDLTRAMVKEGFNPAYPAIYLRVNELFNVLATRIGAQSIGDVTAAIDKARLTVKVNPSYGTWDPSSFSLSDTPPDFLTLTAGGSGS
ncbi:MAG: hypothetical protein FWD74_04205 [Actinomycetia bacterium]|nr:hypothetical protein [Actinomycetes bacterium]